MKECLMSLVIREMQIKKTLRFHLAAVRMATKKTKKQMLAKICWMGGR
jgi:hypothetical protein